MLSYSIDTIENVPSNHPSTHSYVAAKVQTFNNSFNCEQKQYKCFKLGEAYTTTNFPKKSYNLR